jgi:hypothetical protein
VIFWSILLGLLCFPGSAILFLASTASHSSCRKQTQKSKSLRKGGPPKQSCSEKDQRTSDLHTQHVRGRFCRQRERLWDRRRRGERETGDLGAGTTLSCLSFLKVSVHLFSLFFSDTWVIFTAGDPFGQRGERDVELEFPFLWWWTTSSFFS